MSTPAFPPAPQAVPPPAPAAPTPRRRPSALASVRADTVGDLRSDGRRLAVLVGLLVLGGIVAGVVWGLWAPRDRIQVVDGGYAILNVNDEARVGGDVVLLLMLAGLALVATVAVWVRGPRRGAVALLSLVVGLLLAGYVAWLVGHVVSPSPTASELRKVGTVVDVEQQLHSQATLLLPAAVAALLYAMISLFSGYDGLQRRAERPAAPPGDGSAAPRWDTPSVLPGDGAELEGADGQRPEGRQQPDLLPQQGDLGPQARHG